MKYSVYIFALVLFGVALLVPHSTVARESQWAQYSHHHGLKELPAWPRTRDHSNNNNIAKLTSSYGKRKQMMEETNAHPLQIAGSRLPDCSHACGSCSPCKLIIVSSLCASLAQAAETCPVSYRCMCNNKSYPVP